MCYSFRGGRSNPRWGSFSQANLGNSRQLPGSKGYTTHWGAAGLGVGKRAHGKGWRDGATKRTGDCREPWMTEATDEGERRFYQPLLGKQSTKPLRQSGCIAHASVLSWRREQIPCPRVGLIELSLLYENSKSWREVLVWGNWEHYIPTCTVYSFIYTFHISRDYISENIVLK